MKNTKRALGIGCGLLISFAVVLILLFSPVFNGQRPIDYLDNLYNSISKGSVYYISGLQADVQKLQGKELRFSIRTSSPQQAEEMASLFGQTGATVEKSDSSLQVTGNLDTLLNTALADSDVMFKNQGQALAAKYGMGERNVLYYWWLGLKAAEKQLTRDERFAEAKFVYSVITRAVECSFNYYQVEPRSMSTAVVLVVVSLAFYVLYTLWFGFSILYIFIGLGLKLEH